jgi:hypothetical protein
MASVTFDTLKFVKQLEAAGVPAAQAEAEARALAEVLQANLDDLATKRGLKDLELALRRDLSEMKYDLLKWVVGIALAQIGLLIGILVKLL